MEQRMAKTVEHTMEDSVSLISLDELKMKIDRGDDFILLEALAEEYYRKEHLPGAKNLPYEHVAELAPSVVPDKNAEVVLYCMSPL